MKSNQALEQVFELLEKNDFNELSEKDRLFVLSEMTLEEYILMRKTVRNTEAFFSKSKEPILNDSLLKSIIHTNHKANILIKLLNQPVRIYQMAACIVLMIAIYTIQQYSDLPDKTSSLPVHDTIYIQKTDTVYSRLADSVRILKEKIIYISGGNEINYRVAIMPSSLLAFNVDSIFYRSPNESITKAKFTKDDFGEMVFLNQKF